MFNTKILGIDICVKLNNGVYRLEPNSATGKSRLGLLLDKGFSAGINSYYYSYEDFIKGVNYEKVFNDNNFDVILIDRLDMFIKDCNIINVIYQLKDKSIFLLDLKHLTKETRDISECILEMKENSIEVY